MNKRNSNNSIFQTDEDITAKKGYYKPFDNAPSCPSPLSSAKVISSSNLQQDVDVPKLALSSSTDDSRPHSQNTANIPPRKQRMHQQQSTSPSSMDISPRSNISPLPSKLTPRPSLVTTKSQPLVKSPVASTPDTNHYAALILQSRAVKLNKWGHTANVPSGLSSSVTPSSIRRHPSHHIRRGSADVRSQQVPIPAPHEPLRRMRTVSVVEPSLEHRMHDVGLPNNPPKSEDRDVKWVDWLEEYQQMKNAKIKSDQLQASSETLTPKSIHQEPAKEGVPAKPQLPPVICQQSSDFRFPQNKQSSASLSTDFKSRYLGPPSASTLSPGTSTNRPELRRKKSHQLGAKIESWWSAVKTNFLSGGPKSDERSTHHDKGKHPERPPSLTLPDFTDPFSIPDEYLDSASAEVKSPNTQQSLLTAQLKGQATPPSDDKSSKPQPSLTALGINTGTAPSVNREAKLPRAEAFPKNYFDDSVMDHRQPSVQGMPISVMQSQIKARLTKAKEQTNKEVEWVSDQVTEYVENELRKNTGDEEEEDDLMDDGAVAMSLNDSPSNSSLGIEAFPSSYSNKAIGVPLPRKSSVSRRFSASYAPSSPIRKISVHNLDPMKQSSPVSISPHRGSIRSVSHVPAKYRQGSPSSSRSPSRTRSPPPSSSLVKAELDDDLDVDIGKEKEENDEFMEVLQDLILMGQEIIDTPLSTYISNPELCRSIVQRARQLGTKWDANPAWEGRQWYIQFLLAVAGLSRIVEWWEAEKGFWNFDESDDEKDPIKFVVRDDGTNIWIRNPDELSPKPTNVMDPESQLRSAEIQAPPPSSTRSSPPLSLHSKPLVFDDTNVSPDQEGDKPQDSQIHSHRPDDLDKAIGVERTQHILVDLSLDDAKFQFIAPVWADVVGTNPDDLYGRPISEVLAPEDETVFIEATQAFYKDDQSIKEVRFGLYVVPEYARDGEEIDYDFDSGNYVEFEAKGMMMKERYSGEFTHTMWVMKPVPPTKYGIELKESEAVRSGGVFDLEVARQQSTVHQLIMSGNKEDLEKPLLCRICELEIPLWFFERHNETCNEIHRLEMDINGINESLSEFIEVINDLKGILGGTKDGEALYEGANFRDVTDAHGRRSSVKHIRVLDHLYEGVETALDISTPGAKDEKEAELPIEQQRLLSPSSESKYQQVKLWQKPITDDEALNKLLTNIEPLLQAKLRAVTRMRNTIIYTEKIRQEWEEAIKQEFESVSVSSRSSEASSPMKLGAPQSSDTGSSLNAPSYYPYIGSSELPSRADTPIEISGVVPNSASRKLSKEISIHSSSGDEKRHDKEAGIAVPRASHIFDTTQPFAESPRSLTVPQSNTPEATSVSPSNTSPLSKMASGEYSPSSRVNSPPVSVKERGHKKKRSKGSISAMPSGSPSTTTRYVGFEKEGSSSPHTPSSFTLETESRHHSSRLGLHSPRMSIVPTARTTPASIRDFEVIKPISKGAFGSVYLAKKRATGDYYAIKILRKADMISKNQVTNVRAERTILMSTAESPFVAKLFFTFQTRDHLFLVMEYLNGGDCASLIKQLGGLSEEWAKRYMAEVVLCLEHLHGQNIVHRLLTLFSDMKPDNLLIDQKGHLRLTDFGLSKIGLLGRQARGTTSDPSRQKSNQNHELDVQGISYLSPSNDTTSLPASNSFIQSYFSNTWGSRSRRNSIVSESDTSGNNRSLSRGTPPNHSDESSISKSRPQAFAGTPDYLAPETILGYGGDDMAVDWWAIGVILYEFLYGIPPFNDATPSKVFENILSRRINWHEDDPDYEVSPEARDLMEKLLCSDPQKRLGANGAWEVKSHPFFADIDWEKLMTMEAAFIPDAANPEDTDYFDPRGALNDDFATQIEALNKAAAAEHQHESAPMTPPTQYPASPALPTDAALPSESATAGPGTPGSETSSANFSSSKRAHDDFGPFSFKNLPVLKQANDEVIRKMRNEFITANSVSSDEEQLSPVERVRRGSSTRQRKMSTSLQNKKPNSWNLNSTGPPSPSTSTASSSIAESNIIRRKSSQPHSRKPSDSLAVERLKAQLGKAKATRSRNVSISDNSEAFKGIDIGTPPTSISSIDATNDRPVDVLIADDNPISLKILETLLTRLGCRCVVVRDGTDAVSCAMGEIEFDIMFFDIEMPNLNGESAARAIRNLSNLNQTKPIVAVSSFKTDLKIQEQGVWSATMNKPVQKSQLTVIMKHFGFQTAALRQSSHTHDNTKSTIAYQ
ncbi:hypothetical protein E3Q06_01294 [Wallemia mellicola]|nr:hypothetical protein E3Q24_01341 [Wallemia mellicola]TIB87157.1 hypothetical protein E3Q21_01393 [Wallemia mellicola]TIB90126.1 hypothetical protein E3Q20_01380 [Wallemia mellicola]TIC42013.1 hypothetical protein E3Q07_01293 [Wallemia mellicola]TIC50571.1 hypothetical protein E3Q06_01294 [Wallemia mellicola]